MGKYLKNIPIINAYPQILATHFDIITETFDALKNNHHSYPSAITTTKKANDISANITPIKSISAYLESLRKNPLYKFDRNVYISGQSEKGDKKIRDAEKAYAHLQKGETSLLCIDTTILGTSKEGMLATTKGLYLKDRINKNFYPYDKFPNLIIHSTTKKHCYILFGLEMNKGIETKLNFHQTFLLVDLLNQFQSKFIANQKNLKFTTWKLLVSDFIKNKKFLLSILNSKLFLFYWYGEEQNKKLYSAIEKYFKIPSSERILIIALTSHSPEEQESLYSKHSTLPYYYEFFATTKGIYFKIKDSDKYKNVFCGYAEIHSFTTIFSEYTDDYGLPHSDFTKILVYCSEKNTLQ